MKKSGKYLRLEKGNKLKSENRTKRGQRMGSGGVKEGKAGKII